MYKQYAFSEKKKKKQWEAKVKVKQTYPTWSQFFPIT